MSTRGPSLLIIVLALLTCRVGSEAPRHCPSGCQCIELDLEMWDVQCQGDYEGESIAQLARLPANTTKLTLTSSQFNFDLLEFSHLRRLEKLVFADPNPRSYIYNSTFIYNKSLFVGMDALKHLSINIFLRDTKAEVFSPLVSLTTLDLSNTRRFGFSKCLTLFQNFQPLPIKNLRLQNIQHGFDSGDLVYLNQLLKSLAKFPLRHLDISENGVVDLTPGFNEYLPQLEEFVSRYNTFTGADTNTPCWFIDLLLHPKLAHIDLSHSGEHVAAAGSDVQIRRRRHLDNQPSRARLASEREEPVHRAFTHSVTIRPQSRPSSSTYRRTRNNNNRYNTMRKKGSVWSDIFDVIACPPQSLNATSVVCARVECLCAGLTTIPCSAVPSASSLAASDPNCTLGVLWPLPPSLQAVSIHHIAAYASFLGSRNDNVICVSGVNVTYIDASYSDVGRYLNPFDLTLKGLGNVTYLNLQSNEIIITNYGILKGFNHVETLLLGINKIRLDTKDASMLFEGLSRIKVLDLARNGITSIHEDVLASLVNLKILNMSGNAITMLDLQFPLQSSLTWLDVSDNKIAVFSENMMKLVDRMANVSLDLTGNHLSCLCGDLAFVRWLRQTRARLVRRNDYRCTHPLSRSVAFFDVDVEQLDDSCNPSHGAIIASSVLSSLGGILVVCLGYLTYKRRWRIRFYLYAARRGWNKYRNNARVENFVNDAFVIYNSEDRGWVHDTLRIELEDVHGLKLCIHYRDFIPGHNIQDQIVNSIETSRKALVVLSPAFLESSWCSFEMQMAQMKAISEGLNVLVLVILRDLPVAGVNKTLSRLLESKTYVKWDEDRDAQVVFWDKLMRAMCKDDDSDGCTTNV